MTALDSDRTRRQHEKDISDLRIRFESLTPRERQVMALVTSGLMNKQAAAEVGLSEVTVKIHRGNVMKKMGAKSLGWIWVRIGQKRAGAQSCEAMTQHT